MRRKQLVAAVITAFGMLAAAGAQPTGKDAKDATRRIALAGSMGSQALISIDGGAPRVVAVGSSIDGVKLLSMSGTEAVIEADGRRRTLRLGEAAVNLGGKPSAGSGREIVLSGDARGHFMANGQINGRGVAFMVDTGATTVALGQDEAQRIGLNYKDGRRVGLQTANGLATGYLVALDSVRIGDVEVFNVEAVVQPQPMPFVLLGNSFLVRFQMKRENDTLTLSKRY